MDNKIKQCYQDLELDETASADDVKRAWRQLAKVWHPDRFPNDEKLQQRGQEKLKKINAAYELLSDYLANPPSPKPHSQPSQNHQQHAPPQPPKTSAAESDFQRDSKLELLKATIKREIEKQFAQNPATRAAYILSFNLTPATSNLYKGFFAVSINGKSETLTMTVWDGEERIQWEREKLSIEQPKQATPPPSQSYSRPKQPTLHPPQFIVEPQDVKITEGETARFTAMVDDVANSTFQWYKVNPADDGQALVGETHSELVIKNPASGTFRYAVIAGNSIGKTQSRVAYLDVVQDLTILSAPCDNCHRPIDFYESKAGETVRCKMCGNQTFLPYGASVRHEGKYRGKSQSQSQKPFVNQNNSQANNAEEGSGGNKIGRFILALIGGIIAYLIFSFIAYTILGDTFFYKLLLYSAIGFLIGIINKISRSNK